LPHSSTSTFRSRIISVSEESRLPPCYSFRRNHLHISLNTKMAPNNLHNYLTWRLINDAPKESGAHSVHT
jgi:hypothetical protein